MIGGSNFWSGTPGVDAGLHILDGVLGNYFGSDITGNPIYSQGLGMMNTGMDTSSPLQEFLSWLRQSR